MTIVSRPVLLLTAGMLLCLTAIQRLHAQPVLGWDKTVGGASWDELNGLLALPDGFLAAGSSRSGLAFGNPADLSWNFLLVKLDFDGNVVWTRLYGGDLDDRLWAIIPTADGGFLAGGHSYSGVSGDKSQPSRGDMDVWILKLDGDGQLEWERTYGGLYRDELFDMLELPGGGYLLGCNSWSDVWMEKSEPSRGLQDYWLIRTDAQGNKLWDKTVGGDNYDQLNDLEWAADGNVYVSGGTVSAGGTGDLGPEPARGGMDFWLGKLNPGTGALLWDHRYGGSGEDYAYALHVATTGRLFLGGRSGSAPAPPGAFGNGKDAPLHGGDSDYWLLELDAGGVKMNDRSFGGAGLDDLYAIHENPLGQLVLGGVSDSGVSGNKTSTPHGGYDYWLLGLDVAGNVLWQQTLGGAGNDALTKIAFRPDGGFAVGGHSDSGIGFEKTENNLGVNDFWVLSFECDLVMDIALDGVPSPCASLPVLLDAAVAGCAGCTYIWNTGDTGSAISLPSDTSGVFIASAVDTYGCAASDTAVLSPLPPPTIDLGPTDTLIPQGRVVQIGPDPLPGYLYQWNTGDTTAIIAVSAAGQYEVTVTDPGGCTAVGRIGVNVARKGAVWVPNIFSPNFDGHNDYLGVYTDESVRQVVTFQVADRWGTLCFRRDRFLPNYAPDGWDGVYRNAAAPPGVYSWFAEIEYLDGSRDVFEGSATIVR